MRVIGEDDQVNGDGGGERHRGGWSTRRERERERRIGGTRMIETEEKGNKHGPWKAAPWQCQIWSRRDMAGTSIPCTSARGSRGFGFD